MGDDALAALGELDLPLPANSSRARDDPAAHADDRGALLPDIDDSLDEQDAKRDFWQAFRALGEWWAAQPPY